MWRTTTLQQSISDAICGEQQHYNRATAAPFGVAGSNTATKQQQRHLVWRVTTQQQNNSSAILCGGGQHYNRATAAPSGAANNNTTTEQQQCHLAVAGSKTTTEQQQRYLVWRTTTLNAILDYLSNLLVVIRDSRSLCNAHFSIHVFATIFLFDHILRCLRFIIPFVRIHFISFF